MPALRCGDCAVNVVITGANRGLGLGMAQLYAERGDTVFAGARQVDEAPELQALVRAHGKSVHADVQTATHAMVSTIDKLQLAQSGGFFNYDGAAIPW